MNFSFDDTRDLSNDEIHHTGFQDDKGIYHWSDGHSLNDGNVPPFDMHDVPHHDPEITNTVDTTHDLEINTDNEITGSEEAVSEADNGNSDGVNTAEDCASNYTYNNDRSSDVSFGSGYYFYSPNGERLYKSGDGHVYDYNNNRIA